MGIRQFWWLVPALLVNLSAGEEGYFWQLTDLHYDPWYHINQESCNKNLSVVGKYGDFECDAPWDLVYESVKAMMYKGGDPDFILWSGDNPPHAKNSDVLNEDIIMEITKNVTEVILEFFPDKLVLPVLGNHDFYPKNQLPGESNSMYDAYVNLWSMWLNTTDMKDTFKKGGYYTCMLSNSPKVRAVVLNTNLYLSHNEATAGDPDPGNQLAWFETVMNQARNIGEKVHVFYHVPVGKVPEGGGAVGWLRPEQNSQLRDKLVAHSDIILGMYSAHAHQDTFKIFKNKNGYMEVPGTPRWLKEEFNRLLYDLIVKYSDVIIGYYGAHSHSDTFRMFYNDRGDAVSSMFIPPSVTPWKARLGETTGPPHNPALRRYIFHKSSYELIDVEQFSLNLQTANSRLEAEWLFLYSFRQSYSLTDISTGQLQLLLDEMKTYASEKFHRYYDLNTVDTKLEEDPPTPCDCLCKSTHLCAIEFVDYTEFDECYAEIPACGACRMMGSLTYSMVLGLLVVLKGF